jgi:hypothetical protein
MFIPPMAIFEPLTSSLRLATSHLRWQKLSAARLNEGGWCSSQPRLAPCEDLGLLQ